MKKMLTLALALIVIGSVNANDVRTESPVGMSVMKAGSVVKLFYKAGQVGTVKIAIYNQGGRIVFSETIRERDNFMRPYNFSALPAGDYTIELSDADGKRTQKITHATPSEKRIAHLSRLSQDGNTYLLAVPNEGEDELTVRIFNESNALLYQDTEIVNGNFAKVYNLNKVNGNLTFEIVDRAGKVNRLSRPAASN